MQKTEREIYTSVIIPNTDSPVIGEVITALMDQADDLTGVEIIVVGTDRPGLVPRECPVTFVQTPESSFCASDKRNLGMRLASGEIYAFLDDDCVPLPGWLERHLLHHRQGEQVVGGAVRFAADNYFQLSDNVSAFHDLLPYTTKGPRSFLATANLSVHRQVVSRAGFMEAGRNRAEDLEWTARFRKFGYTLYFDPGAVVDHNPARRNLLAVWRHWTGDSRDTLRVRLRYPQLLNTPSLAKYRSLYLWMAPAVAAWATARTFSHPITIRRYWHTLPLVFLTKLAWCWGAYQQFPTIEN